MPSTPTFPDLIQNLPKCELHVHLEGCLTPSLAQTLATRNKMTLPPSVTASISSKSDWAIHDRASFISISHSAMTVLQTRQDFHDLAWDYLIKAHAQKVRRAEMFFDPQAHTSRGVSFDTVLDGCWDAVLRSRAELNLSAGLIMCIQRDHDVESATATLDQGLRDGNRDRIIGIGLDSDERDNQPAKFAAIFARARTEGAQAGWKLTMHCDIDQENTLVHLRQALVDIRVDRIDHGTNVIEDEELVELVRSRGIGLTCCPISYSMVTSDFKEKEIVSLMRRGVRTTVNSDDPAYLGGYIAENFKRIGEDTDASESEIVQLARNAFEVAWVTQEERRGWLDELDRYEKNMLGT